MSDDGKTVKGTWKLDDLIAFECALASDEREEWSTLRERDAAMRLEDRPGGDGSRRSLIKRWLAKRLDQEPEIKLAADSISQSFGVAGQLLGVVAMLAGLGSATTALAYTGEAPINVSTFFAVFVLLQAVWAVVLLLAFLLPRGAREACAFGPVFRFGRWVLNFLFSKTQSLAGRFLTGQQRMRAAEIAGTARRAVALHGGVAKWLSFVKLQAAALFFNFGVLIALLVAVAFSDRAFGWQTTLDVSNASIHEIVKIAATPWSWWLGEGKGYPNAEQIEGSRIVLKDGIRELESGDLAAWWKFLALGVLVYGMLPRLLFYALGKWQVSAALKRYDFTNAAAERLVQRLRPEVGGFDAEAVSQAEPLEGRSVGGAAELAGRGRRVRCLLSRELSEFVDSEALIAALAKRWRLDASRLEAAVYVDGQMAESLGESAAEEQVALVFESWMPPIREIERQVKALRSQIEEKVLIKVVLLGIPASEGPEISLKPEQQYAEAWHSFVLRMGDPYLILDNPAT